MQEQLVVWNEESELLQRAATPRIEWFPVPRHAAALQPLIWLLACVPILVALLQTPWTEESAQWGLRSLRLLSAAEWGDFLDPGDTRPDGTLRLESPLMTWISAASLSSLGPSHLVSVILPAIVCVFAYVMVAYAISFSLGGAWVGLLTAFLVATHPDTWRLVHRPTSLTVGLLCSIVSLWSFQRHIDSKSTVWSRWLLTGSIALGGCFLSHGPLTLVTLFLSVLYVTSVPKCGTMSRRIIPLNRKAGCPDWRSWKSFAVWLASGMLIGGWWPLMMSLLHGSEFWTVWIGMVADAPATVIPIDQIHNWSEQAKFWFRETAALMPLMSGFVLLGGYRMWRIVWKNQEPAQRRAQYFLMLWMLAAVVLWQFSLLGFEISFLKRSTWTSYVVLPASMLAAGGLLEIGERRAGFGTALAAYGVGVAVAVWRYRGLWLDVSKFWNQFALVVSLAILFGGCFWLTLRFIYGNELRQRGLVRGGIWSLLLVHCAWGINLLPLNLEPRVPSGQQPLLQFWTDLRNWRGEHPESIHESGELILMTSDKSQRLQYVVQSVWPHREFKRVSSWDAIPPPHPHSGSRVIVTYGSQDLLLPSASTAESPLVPIIASRIYRDGELTAYELH
ncbi:MAG: hypothetical protein JWM11_6691 [Planctomycetaceae bacterium]|nr:hypothetical protein [Planctomycetaceae bacterium]